MSKSTSIYIPAIKRKLLLITIGLLCLVSLPLFTTTVDSYKEKASVELVYLTARKITGVNAVYTTYAVADKRIISTSHKQYKAAFFYYNRFIISRINCYCKKFVPKTNTFALAHMKLLPRDSDQSISFL